MRYATRPLLLFTLLLSCIQLMAQRHVIVSYDFSGSMVDKNMMKASDIKRLNKYLVSILYDDVVLQPTKRSDNIVTSYSGELKGPLLREDDILTVQRMGTNTRILINRQTGTSSLNLLAALPEKREEFVEQDTYLKVAKVQVFEDLVREDEETYWIFISDEDEDRARGDAKNPRVEKKLNEIDILYEVPVLQELMVKNWVSIRVHRVARKGLLMEEALARKDREALELIEIERAAAAKREEEFRLALEAERLEKERIERETRDKQIATNRAAQERLARERAAAEQKIRDLEAKRERELAAERDAALRMAEELEKLRNNTQSQEAQVFLALADKPLEKLIRLPFPSAEGDTLESQPVIVNSETGKAAAFKMQNYELMITDARNKKLYTETVSLAQAGLKQPFALTIPHTGPEFTWDGNKITLTLNYTYDGTEYSSRFQTAYQVDRPAPTWILGILGLLILVGGLIWLIRVLMGKAKANDPLHITLARLSGSDQALEKHAYTLHHGNRITFNNDIPGTFTMDIACEGFLECRHNTVLLSRSDRGSAGESLISGDTFQLTNFHGNSVSIAFTDERPAADPFSSTPDNPGPGPELSPASDLLNR